MKGLEFILKFNNMSFTDLAEKLGITKQNISMWMSGNRKIPKKYVNTLSEIFNVDKEYLTKEIDLIDGLNIQSKLYEKEAKETGDFSLEQKSYVLKLQANIQEVKENIEKLLTVEDDDKRYLGDIEDTIEIISNALKCIESGNIPLLVLRSLIYEISRYPSSTILHIGIHSEKELIFNKKLLKLLDERTEFYKNNYQKED